VVAERMKQGLIDKQKELDVIKSDTNKLEELRKKAMRSAVEFNSELQAVRRSERKHFWDIQTSIIQSPSGRWYRVPKEQSRPSPYPCAVLPGQYTSHVKPFAPEQLRQWPVSTVLETKDLFAPKRVPSPPAIHVSEEELLGKGNSATSAENSPAAMPREESVDRQQAQQLPSSAQHTPVSAPRGRPPLIRRSSTSSSLSAGRNQQYVVKKTAAKTGSRRIAAEDGGSLTVQRVWNGRPGISSEHAICLSTSRRDDQVPRMPAGNAPGLYRYASINGGGSAEVRVVLHRLQGMRSVC